MRKTIVSVLMAALTLGTGVYAAAPADGDKPAAQAGAQRGGAAVRPGEVLELLRQRLAKLELTAEQKQAIDKAFDEATAALKELREEAKGDPQAMREALAEAREILTELRETVRDTLTEEQRAKLMEGVGQDFPQAGALMDMLKQVLAELNLTDEQKESVKKLTDDLRKQVGELRRQAGGGGEGVAEEARKLMREYMEQVRALLTDEQKATMKEKLEKARERMQQRREGGADGAGRPGDRLRERAAGKDRD